MSNVHHNTNAGQRQILVANGFVRVDGLTVEGCGNYEIVAAVSQLGCISQNNGTWGLTTDGGEMWISRANLDDSTVAIIRAEITPAKGGSFVPCSNGEKLDVNDVLARIADPDCPPLRRR